MLAPDARELVQELVQLHGGTITASSIEGEGTAFTVRLPFGHAHLPAGDPTHRASLETRGIALTRLAVHGDAFVLARIGLARRLLHADGVFHWYYWWWNVATFPVIVVFGYLTFYVVAFIVYDMPSRERQPLVGLLVEVGWKGSPLGDRVVAGQVGRV